MGMCVNTIGMYILRACEYNEDVSFTCVNTIDMYTLYVCVRVRLSV